VTTESINFNTPVLRNASLRVYCTVLIGFQNAMCRS